MQYHTDAAQQGLSVKAVRVVPTFVPDYPESIDRE
jgi:hypothetical protein